MGRAPGRLAVTIRRSRDADRCKIEPAVTLRVSPSSDAPKSCVSADWQSIRLRPRAASFFALAARLRHIASTKWGKWRYKVMDPLLNPAMQESQRHDESLLPGLRPGRRRY